MPSNVGGSVHFPFSQNRLLWGHFRLNAAVISPGVARPWIDFDDKYVPLLFNVLFLWSIYVGQNRASGTNTAIYELKNRRMLFFAWMTWNFPRVDLLTGLDQPWPLSLSVCQHHLKINSVWLRHGMNWPFWKGFHLAKSFLWGAQGSRVEGVSYVHAIHRMCCWPEANNDGFSPQLCS